MLFEYFQINYSLAFSSVLIFAVGCGSVYTHQQKMYKEKKRRHYGTFQPKDHKPVKDLNQHSNGISWQKQQQDK